jgi:hypothetical protein
MVRVLLDRPNMRHTIQSLLILASASLALADAGCSKSALTPGGGGGNDGGDPSTLACQSATDCTRTEIDHEISSAADCICLYGCPWWIVNVETANRRMAQYAAHCTPNPLNCGVDDCAVPPPVACVSQMCVTGQ